MRYYDFIEAFLIIEKLAKICAMLLELLFEYWPLMISFFIVAILYASVGFGGGSSYLALLAFFELSQYELRPMALICNIVVVSGGLYVFSKQGYLNIKKALPLVALSVPLAFVGGMMRLDERSFFILLGLTLLVASFVMVIQNAPRIEDAKGSIANHPVMNSAIGGGIGFLSGLVGIGGGIFLAPLLHLSGWDRAMVVASTASLFILVNSIAGLIGQWTTGMAELNGKLIAILAIIVFIGGQIGSRWAAIHFKADKVRLVTAVLIAIVGVRILATYLN